MEPVEEVDFTRHLAALDSALQPVAERPIPYLAAAFGVGIVTALILRSRGSLEPDPAGEAVDAARIWSAARSAWSTAPEVAYEELRSTPIPEVDVFSDVRRVIVGAMTGYLDQAVDRMADAAQRTVRG